MSATQGTSGFGTLLQRGNGATAETFTTVAEVRSIGGPNRSREFLEATHMESPSGYREYLPSFKDAGEVTFDVNFLPATSGSHDLLSDDFEAGTLRNWQIVWPDSATTTWSFSAYVASISPTAGVGDMLSATITLRVSGTVTIS